jgi:hypothetical protein
LALCQYWLHYRGFSWIPSLQQNLLPAGLTAKNTPESTFTPFSATRGGNQSSIFAQGIAISLSLISKQSGLTENTAATVLPSQSVLFTQKGAINVSKEDGMMIPGALDLVFPSKKAPSKYPSADSAEKPSQKSPVPKSQTSPSFLFPHPSAAITSWSPTIGKAPIRRSHILAFLCSPHFILFLSRFCRSVHITCSLLLQYSYTF